MTTHNMTSIHNQHAGKHTHFDTTTPHIPPSEKILDIILFLSVRDPISFDFIHTRYLKCPADWLAFISYASSSPNRDGLGYTVRQAITRFLSTCDINNITRSEAIILTRICRPRPDQIPNLRPLFERIRICDD